MHQISARQLDPFSDYFIFSIFGACDTTHTHRTTFLNRFSGHFTYYSKSILTWKSQSFLYEEAKKKYSHIGFLSVYFIFYSGYLAWSVADFGRPAKSMASLTASDESNVRKACILGSRLRTSTNRNIPMYYKHHILVRCTSRARLCCEIRSRVYYCVR